MAPTAEMIRRGRKFDQVLEGARQVFMAGGFLGARVDARSGERGGGGEGRCLWAADSLKKKESRKTKE